MLYLYGMSVHYPEKRGVNLREASGQNYPARKNLICNMSDLVVFNASLHPEEN